VEPGRGDRPAAGRPDGHRHGGRVRGLARGGAAGRPGAGGRRAVSGPASWDAVYERLGERGVSWHQAFPAASLELIEAAGGAAGRAVIDVGGGMSPLAGELLARGAARVTVLDVSAVALAGARE